MRVICWDNGETEANGRLGDLITVTSPGLFYSPFVWVLMLDNKKLEWFYPKNIRRV